jgi:hemolysin III
MPCRPYRRAEQLADNAVHIAGVAFGIAGAVWPAIMMPALPSLGERLSVAVYALALLAMLSASAAYNIWPLTPVKAWLRRIDHSAIYIMIAGTYTPFIAQIPSGWTPLALLTVVWGVAIAGLMLKLVLPGQLDRLSIVLYLALGWSGLAAYDALRLALGPGTLWLLAVGGAIYSAGVVFHLAERLPFQNALWHLFVLGGAGVHYVAVLGLL